MEKETLTKGLLLPQRFAKLEQTSDLKMMNRSSQSLQHKIKFAYPFNQQELLIAVGKDSYKVDRWKR